MPLKRNILTAIWSLLFGICAFPLMAQVIPGYELDCAVFEYDPNPNSVELIGSSTIQAETQRLTAFNNNSDGCNPDSVQLSAYFYGLIKMYISRITLEETMDDYRARLVTLNETKNDTAISREIRAIDGFLALKKKIAKDIEDNCIQDEENAIVNYAVGWMNLNKDCEVDKYVSYSLVPKGPFYQNNKDAIHQAASDAFSSNNYSGSYPSGCDNKFCRGMVDRDSALMKIVEEISCPEDGFPIVGLAKDTGIILNLSYLEGRYSIEFEFAVKNYTNSTLSNVQVTDNLSLVFPTECTIDTLIFPNQTSPFTFNSSYGDNQDWNMLAGTDSLEANAQSTFKLYIEVSGCEGEQLKNSALVSVRDTGDVVHTDSSHVGTNPDGDGDNDPRDDNEETLFLLFTSIPTPPYVGIAKKMNLLSEGPNGSYIVDFEILVKNYGTEEFEDFAVKDELIHFLPDPCEIQDIILSSPDNLNFNSNYNNYFDYELLASPNPLGAEEEKRINLQLQVKNCDINTEYLNRAIVAIDYLSETLRDTSENGLNPDPDDDGNPTNNQSYTPVKFDLTPRIGISKELTTIEQREDKTYELTFTFKIKNYGYVNLKKIQFGDDLTQTFPYPAHYDTVFATVSEGLTLGDLVPSFILAGEDELAPGQEEEVILTVIVDRFEGEREYENSVFVYAENTEGDLVSDESVDGSDPDPDGDGDPSNNASPTIITFPAEISCLEEMQGNLTNVTTYATYANGSSPHGDGNLTLEWDHIEGVTEYYISIMLLNAELNEMYSNSSAFMNMGEPDQRSYFSVGGGKCQIELDLINGTQLTENGANLQMDQARYGVVLYSIAPLCQEVDVANIGENGQLQAPIQEGYNYAYFLRDYASGFMYEDQGICEGKTGRLGIAYQFNSPDGPDCSVGPPANAAQLDVSKFEFLWHFGESPLVDSPCFNGLGTCSGYPGYCSRISIAPDEESIYTLHRTHIEATLHDFEGEESAESVNVLDKGDIRITVFEKGTEEYGENCEFVLSINDPTISDRCLDKDKGGERKIVLKTSDPDSIFFVKWQKYDENDNFLIDPTDGYEATIEESSVFAFSANDPVWDFDWWYNAPWDILELPAGPYESFLPFIPDGVKDTIVYFYRDATEEIYEMDEAYQLQAKVIDESGGEDVERNADIGIAAPKRHEIDQSEIPENAVWNTILDVVDFLCNIVEQFKEAIRELLDTFPILKEFLTVPEVCGEIPVGGGGDDDEDDPVIKWCLECELERAFFQQRREVCESTDITDNIDGNVDFEVVFDAQGEFQLIPASKIAKILRKIIPESWMDFLEDVLGDDFFEDLEIIPVFTIEIVPTGNVNLLYDQFLDIDPSGGETGMHMLEPGLVQSIDIDVTGTIKSESAPYQVWTVVGMLIENPPSINNWQELLDLIQSLLEGLDPSSAKGEIIYNPTLTIQFRLNNDEEPQLRFIGTDWKTIRFAYEISGGIESADGVDVHVPPTIISRLLENLLDGTQLGDIIQQFNNDPEGDFDSGWFTL